MDIESQIKTEWIGTSTFCVKENIDLQKNGELPLLIQQRERLVQEIAVRNYDPTPYITLGYVDVLLGFTDITTANAYKALVLVEAAFNRMNGTPTFPPNLGDLVISAIYSRTQASSPGLVISPGLILIELRKLQKQSYTMTVTGLSLCAATWEGFQVAEKASKLFPKSKKILALKESLETGSANKDSALPKTGRGKFFQKPYPWMDHKLSNRTPSLVRDVNQSLAGGNCEVRHAFFGQGATVQAARAINEDDDVGPLGMFATRDIKEGELVMVDKSITGITNVSSSTIRHCDACQACLFAPYMIQSKIIRPECGCHIGFCSKSCHDEATRNYHTVLCGKDFSWLYKDIGVIGPNNPWSRWRSISFLRIVAVVLADLNRPEYRDMHPLEHPLLARMTASYPAPGTIYPDPHDYYYFEYVVAPAKILMQLGINIFESTKWTPEVIQTIFWRIENNANQSTTSLLPGAPAVHLVSINENYLFINHSCEPNTSWHGAVPDSDVSVEWLRDMSGDILRPGSSTVWCYAGKDIKQDEELTISYIGDPLGNGFGKGVAEPHGNGNRAEKRAMLSKWFENGCGCRICEEENKITAEDDVSTESCEF